MLWPFSVPKTTFLALRNQQVLLSSYHESPSQRMLQFFILLQSETITGLPMQKIFTETVFWVPLFEPATVFSLNFVPYASMSCLINWSTLPKISRILHLAVISDCLVRRRRCKSRKIKTESAVPNSTTARAQGSTIPQLNGHRTHKGSDAWRRGRISDCYPVKVCDA